MASAGLDGGNMPGQMRGRCVGAGRQVLSKRGLVAWGNDIGCNDELPVKLGQRVQNLLRLQHESIDV